MQDLNDLYYFAKVVEHGSFAATARALGVAKSKLSRRISALEARLDVRLIQRSTRRFEVTDIGQVYYQHCKAMLVEAAAAQESIALVHAEPCGVVRLTCPVTLLQAEVATMLAEFMQRYPEVSLQVEASNREVDLVAERVDIALRVRPTPLHDSELFMRPLAERQQCLLASPSLLARYDKPQTPSDLQAWPSLGFGRAEQSFNWHLQDQDSNTVKQPYQPRYIASDMLALREAALQGVGLVQLPHRLVAADLSTKRLVQLLPQWALPSELVHAVFPTRRGQLPAVSVLLDHLRDRFAAEL